MKLFYYNEHFNFGDALNPWLWSKLLPDVLDQDEQIAFIGIGTLLNEWLAYRTPLVQQRVIFGTGVGYGNGLPQLNQSDHIYCLRGPLSARALGLDPSLAVTDGAVLLRRCFEPPTQKIHRFAYMPHWQHADCDWQLVCKELGWDYIDPRWSISRILAAISQTEVLLAEAMHGAIIADALRVPWIPIATNTGVLAFKWHDWCQSIDLEYNPVLIQPPVTFLSLNDTFDRSSLVRDWMSQKQAIYQFREIANTIQPKLSTDRKIEDLTCELESKLAQFRTDVDRGNFRLAIDLQTKPAIAPPVPESTIATDLTQFYSDHKPRQIQCPERGISALFCPAPASEINRFRNDHQIITPYLILLGTVNHQFIDIHQAIFELQTSGKIELIYISEKITTSIISPYLKLRVLNLKDRSHLVAAYSGAIAVIDLTSSNEFDWRIVEAMACGCPVIIDRDSVHSSIAKSAILNPKYTDRVSIDNTLNQLQDPELRQPLVKFSLEFAKHFSLAAVGQIVANQLVDLTSEIQAGGVSSSDSLSWYQLRLFQRSIVNKINERNQSILRQELATTQQELATTQQELATTQQELATTQQELAITQQELSNAHTQIRSMEQTKIWKVRQAWHRIKRSE